MATANGARAIIEEGRFHVLDLTADLDAQDGYINKALWTLLAHPDVFDIAQKLNRADHLNGRHWRKRKDVPKIAPDVSAEALKELADAISAYYREKQGRGRHCWAETYLRCGRYHYFFVYPQDFTDTFIEFDDDGQFHPGYGVSLRERVGGVGGDRQEEDEEEVPPLQKHYAHPGPICNTNRCGFIN